MKLTKNQQAVYMALLNPDNYKYCLKSIKKETGLKHNKSVLRAFESLKQKGLISEKCIPINQKQGLELDVSGTSCEGIK